MARMWKNFVPATNITYEELQPNIEKKPHLSGAEVSQIYLDIVAAREKDLVETPNLNEQQSESTYIENKLSKKPEVKFKAQDIFVTAQSGDVSEVTAILVNEPTLVNDRDEYGWTPLMISTQAGHVSVVSLLVEHGANIYIKDKAGNSALTLAKKQNNHSIVDILLAVKSSQRKRDKNKPDIVKNIRPVSESNHYCDICKNNYKNRVEHVSSTVHNFNVSKMCKHKLVYGIPMSNKGYQLMIKKGWNEESGLGPHGSGQKFPVKTVLKRDRKGIGIVTNLKAKVTHENANECNYVRKSEWRNEYKRSRRKEKLFERDFRREFL